jgi:hypothetical protein
MQVGQNHAAALQRVLQDNEEELLWVAEVMAGSRQAAAQSVAEAIQLARPAEYVGREWILSFVKRLLVHAVLKRIGDELRESLAIRRPPLPVRLPMAGLSACERQKLRSMSPQKIIESCDVLERSCLILFVYLQYAVLDCALLLGLTRALIESVSGCVLAKAVDLTGTAANAFRTAGSFHFARRDRMRRLSILFIGPAESADLVCEALLLRRHSGLTVAANYWDLCSPSLHERSHFQIAVLIDAGPAHLLRRSAEYIRRRWPAAAILLVGDSPAALEDALYDLRVPSRIEPDDFLTVTRRLDREQAGLEEREAENGIEVGGGRHER